MGLKRDGISLHSHILVTGDAAVDDGFLAGVDDDEGEVDDGVGWWRSVCLLFCLPVSLDQVLESYLLEVKIKKKRQINCLSRNSSENTLQLFCAIISPQFCWTEWCAEHVFFAFYVHNQKFYTWIINRSNLPEPKRHW